jgi:putative Holliday junction resolvase
MKVLGLDIGDSKIGFAIADTSLNTAIPKGIIRDGGRDRKIEIIATIIADEKIEIVVAGMPFNLKGEIAHQAEKVLTFIKHLKKAIQIPVETVDERMTSKVSGDPDADDLAAANILQTWLDIRKNKNIDSVDS